MIAIPGFVAGAMETSGLVTHRETTSLYVAKNSAAANKQRVATVVALQISHQRFEILGMEWWTDLWLNEGSATWVSYLAADGLFPEWKYGLSFMMQIQKIPFILQAPGCPHNAPKTSEDLLHAVIMSTMTTDTCEDDIEFEPVLQNRPSL